MGAHRRVKAVDPDRSPPSASNANAMATDVTAQPTQFTQGIP